MNADLRVVRWTHSGIPPAYQLEELKSQLEQNGRAELRVGLQIQGGKDSPIPKVLFEGLRREGFDMGPLMGSSAESNRMKSVLTPEKGSIVIKGMAKVWGEKGHDGRSVYIRWCADLRVVDEKSERIIEVVESTGREGPGIKHEVYAQATKSIQTAIVSDVTIILSNFIRGTTPDHPRLAKGVC